jgi:GT2 family glycosyltransferase
MTDQNREQQAVSQSVSAVIAARNRPERLRVLLQSLRNQEIRPTEVIVVDDGSEPPLPAFDGVTVQVRLDVPAGACRARNIGVARSSSKYVLLVDDDAELVDRSLIRRAIQLAQRIERLGAIAFRQVDAEGRPQWMQPLPGEDLRLAPTFYGYGALLLREALQTAGCFFEPLHYYYEENELCMRLMDHEFSVLYDPSLEIVHHADPRGRDNRIIHRLVWRNTMFTVIARFPVWLIPGGLAVALARWVWLALQWRELKVSDFWWGGRALVTKLPELLRRRAPIRFATIRRVRSLRSEVVPPELIAPSESVVEATASTE